MSQEFKILIKRQDLTPTGTTSSGLVLNNNYYAYNVKGLNKGIVTEFNVRQFLDDEKNIDVATGFFNYLNDNSTTEQIAEINESNKKLSDLFKKYYNTSVLLGGISPTSFIDEALVSTSSSTVNYYYRYNLLGTTIIESMTGTPATLTATTSNAVNSETEELLTYTNEISYYLPIRLNLAVGESSVLNFVENYAKDDVREYVENGEQKAVFLKQGFVDLNKQLNPNEFWK